MALINCPECGRKNILEDTESCPTCGFKIKEFNEQATKEQNRDAKIALFKKILYNSDDDLGCYFEKIQSSCH